MQAPDWMAHLAAQLVQQEREASANPQEAITVTNRAVLTSMQGAMHLAQTRASNPLSWGHEAAEA